MSATESAPVLEVDGVTAGYGTAFRSARVLRDVSVSVAAGRTLGVVGESGSGKSTLARVIVGQLTPLSGAVRLDGRAIAAMSRSEQKAARRQIQLIPQDPYASLDPRMSIGRTLAEAIAPARSPRRVDRSRIAELLETVALDADAASRLPHEFSGGQRQRIVIARALAVNPRVIVADEITSALDASVQAEILNLMLRLQRDNRLSLVFVTHDLGIAQYMCDELAVLYLGRIVEQGGTDMLKRPTHPYTELLRDSIPGTSGHIFDSPSAALSAEPGDPANPPTGCAFHPRCPYGPLAVSDRQICMTELPALQPRPETARRFTACHFALSADSASV